MPRTPADWLLTETMTADPAWSVVLPLDVSRSAAALAQTTGGDLGTVGRPDWSPS
ncbi:hypothetical protein GT755_08070 [Herbidospora sp. NEAU-GS84]|uniref:Uncharacterized protein n=1 Tax=Herbidospora solisilvae TaxID=2696284 RepID=A0A7C9JS27_9ACTN|nr:hypothetical protein [Herbidospora solisilvae]NAS21639.1 hypothetical protein [Herbidospora solisilvae]